MPFQLRRIIGVNLKNASDGLPSGRVAELDPRGCVLAIGQNGVGKTTFLRLLPVFYGATATQILRGTGRSSYFSYLLPDASSCVVYEYERETDQDLRCAVMHRVEGEDAPEFRIVVGGFQERFCYDAEGQFVLREEFSRRVESMGVEVTRRLFLHQYRAVILQSPGLAKEAAELRPLALRHSLGPKPLKNLERIAAAMANEKINFKDLQSIVIDRVIGSHAESGATDMSRREIKKSKSAVNDWLEEYDHLERVLKAKSDADKLQARVRRTRTLLSKLGTLSQAVAAAIEVVERDTHELQSLHKRRMEEVGQQDDALKATLSELALSVAPKEESREKLHNKIVSAERKAEHFQSIDIETKVREQNLEASLKEQQASAQDELGRLKELAGGVSTRKEEAANAIRSAYTEAIQRIAADETGAAELLTNTLDELREQEQEQLDALPKLERLEGIAAELRTVDSDQGRVNEVIRRPFASEEALAEQAKAAAQASELAKQHRVALDAKSAQEGTERSAAFALQAATDRLTARHHEVQLAAQEVEAVQRQMEPAPGSILDFLRKSDASLWEAAAKLIDPALLSRTDLDPEWVLMQGEGATTPTSQMVTVNGLRLDVEAVTRPDWVDMAGLQSLLTHKRAAVTAAQDALATAAKVAKGAEAEHKTAQVALEKARGAAAVLDAAVDTNAARLTRADAVVAQQKAECKAAHEQEAHALGEKRRSLVTERQTIETGRQQRITEITDSFQAQRNRLKSEHDSAKQRCKKEREQAGETQDAKLRDLEKDYQRELAGLGVDQDRLAAVGERVAGLQKQLRAIAHHRADVDAWKEFQPVLALELPHWHGERDDLDRELSELRQRVREISGNLSDLQSKAKAEFATYDARKGKLEGEAVTLRTLRDIELKEFLGAGAVALDVDWTAEGLKTSARTAKSDLANEEAQLDTEHRKLRNLMLMRAGGVQQWVEQRERELLDADKYTVVEYLCARSNLLIDWFEPRESVPYVEQLNQEMMSFFALADAFVGELEMFDRHINSFNTKLQRALSATVKFDRFSDLSVKVRSGVAQLDYLRVLREMRDIYRSQQSTWRTSAARATELASQEQYQLVRQFREILPADGVVRVNLAEQVRLECSLVENGRARNITNQEEFAAVSSNGLTLIISACYLVGFLRMVVGEDSPVRMTWVTDEIGRLDPGNLDAFLRTLAMHNIDVISASPSVDPALASQFRRLAFFTPTGAILTTDNVVEEAEDVAA